MAMSVALPAEGIVMKSNGNKWIGYHSTYYLS